MSVPDFQSIMLPLLEATSNGKQWQLTAIREELARLFHLSPDERRELLPSEMGPYKFEIRVIDLLQAMGYGGNREEAAQVTKKSVRWRYRRNHQRRPVRFG